MCVQRFDDSLGSAIRITYRISLRSSSLREPRHPLLKVVCCIGKNAYSCCRGGRCRIGWFQSCRASGAVTKGVWLNTQLRVRAGAVGWGCYDRTDHGSRGCRSWIGCGNDPSAGSPTETLLRLHLPLNDEV